MCTSSSGGGREQTEGRIESTTMAGEGERLGDVRSDESVVAAAVEEMNIGLDAGSGLDDDADATGEGSGNISSFVKPSCLSHFHDLDLSQERHQCSPFIRARDVQHPQLGQPSPLLYRVVERADRLESFALRLLPEGHETDDGRTDAPSRLP